ncbi:MAG: hypothetical protein K1X55_11250 [Chitinophagales bacterium]|nr:hypothetical protein [Chitinophagales bacterium]
MALLIFILISYCIIIPVGWSLYMNGRHFLMQIFKDASTTQSVNKILLIGYYLVNIGLSMLLLSGVASNEILVIQFAYYVGRLGVIFLLLGILHYSNIILLNHFKSQIQSFFHPKKLIS